MCLQQYNETLTHHQAEWKEQAQKAAEALRTQSAATETRIKELEEQVRDLMFFIDAKNKIEDSGEVHVSFCLCAVDVVCRAVPCHVVAKCCNSQVVAWCTNRN